MLGVRSRRCWLEVWLVSRSRPLRIRVGERERDAFPRADFDFFFLCALQLPPRSDVFDCWRYRYLTVLHTFLSLSHTTAFEPFARLDDLSFGRSSLFHFISLVSLLVSRFSFFSCCRIISLSRSLSQLAIGSGFAYVFGFSKGFCL